MLSSDIMNIRTRIGGDCGDPHSYRIGHRDARHDATELVLKYERYVELLEDALYGEGKVLNVASWRKECGL